jgi:hypothetical protein
MVAALPAGVAQLVEHKLPKLGVVGSNPISRSKKPRQIRALEQPDAGSGTIYGTGLAGRRFNAAA